MRRLAHKDEKPTDDQRKRTLGLVADYITETVAPLLEHDDAATVDIEIKLHQPMPNEHLLVLRANDIGKRTMLGKGGQTVDALRRLATIRARILGLHERVDIRIPRE